MNHLVHRLVLIACLVIAPSSAFAHGGEDHGEVAKPTGASGPGADGKRTAGGNSEHVELLLKYLAPADDGDVSLLAFLSDYATNAPIEHAKVELELAGPTPVKVVAEATATAGVYHAVARVAPGSYSVVATIEAQAELELVELKHVDFTAAPAAASPKPTVQSLPWKVIGGGSAALILVILIVSVVRWRAVRTKVAAAATILVLVAAPLVVRAHGGEDDEPTPAATRTTALPAGGVYMAKESQFLLAVRTAVAQDREIQARVDTVGRVIPRIDGQATIAAPQPGRITPIGGRALPFIGDRVKRGQALFVLEQTPGAADSGALQSQALQARSEVTQARARRAQAERELARERALDGIVAQKDIQAAELALELADRELQLATQQAALFGSGGLRRLTITSPIDGTIALAGVSIGQQVAADQVVYTIIDATTLWVEANVFEADVPRIETAGTADIRVEGRAQTLVGTVYRIGQTVDPASRTVKVVLAVDNAGGLLRPGMFAQVAIGAGGPQTTLSIPDAAVIEDGGRRFAFVHVAPEVFTRREIVLGPRAGDFWAVSAGLGKGDRVVTQGTYQLRTSR